MISPDLPITKSTEDKLNRGAFAKSLAKTILQYSFPSSFTIGLYGEWGSGKTSLVNMVIEAVEDIDSSAIVLRFNPWLCTDPKQLITQFFKQMATAIKLKKPKAEKAWELIDQYADVFEAASLIPGAGTLIAAVGKTLAKEANERVEQRTKDLQESKNQIVNKMMEENIKIIVSIDDIDRLSEEEIIAVFQLVKALADFPNTVYVLAFDYDVVVHALSKVQYGDGKEYLEKIIQVPFEIPIPSIANIHEALFSELNAILGEIPEERWAKTTWAELFQFGLQKYIKSIRDVIRYTNVLELETIFKSRAIEAIDSGVALKQYQGLNFLWVLGKVDAELAENIKKTLISDDISLIKVISYCTSRGTVATKIVEKTRDVKSQIIGEFIDIDEAYRRVKAFAVTSQFVLLPKDDQMNAIAFILATERIPSEPVMGNSIAEDAITKALNQLREKSTHA